MGSHSELFNVMKFEIEKCDQRYSQTVIKKAEMDEVTRFVDYAARPKFFCVQTSVTAQILARLALETSAQKNIGAFSSRTSRSIGSRSLCLLSPVSIQISMNDRKRQTKTNCNN